MFYHVARRVKLAIVSLLAGLALSAEAPAGDWRQVIRPADRDRLSRLWPAWRSARAATAADAWTALGPLGEPAAATGGSWPAPGAYRCRSFRLGVTHILPIAEAMPCRIVPADGGLAFAASGRFQTSAGRLYPDGDRLVYLGAASLRGDMAPFAYGGDPDRNQVGVLERIGPARWRLALPWPRWQSTLDVVDIVPEPGGAH